MTILIEEQIFIPATVGSLVHVHTLLDRFYAATGQVVRMREDWQHEFATAVIEIATNSIRHAYPPNSVTASMRLRLRLYADRVVASLYDQGIAFAEPAPPVHSLTHTTESLKVWEIAEGGYGLAIARSVLDQLLYRRTTSGINCWKMVKWLPTTDHRLPMVDK